MSNIKSAFDHGKAFIPFVTCGDPDLETTGAIVRAAVENGADLIELGIPFSDPTAEGPVIQDANLRALSGGVTTDKIFAFVKDLRRDVKIPLVFMTYANVVFSYGAERFFAACRDIGVDGLILPDLPYEEKEEFLPLCHQYGVDLISMIAPTSENRIAMIAKEATGFLYIVSSLCVTGTRREIKTDLRPSSRWSGRIPPFPAPSASAFPPRSRRGRWRRSLTAQLSVLPLSKSWKNTAKRRRTMSENMSSR